MESSRGEQTNQKRIVFGYRTIDFPDDSSGSENRMDTKGFGLDPSEPRKDLRYVNDDDHSSNRRVTDCVRQYNLLERSESENPSIEKDIGGISMSSPIHNSVRTFRPGGTIERNGYSNITGQSWMADDRIRNSYFGHPEEGSSSNTSNAHYGYGENMWNNGIPMKPHSGPILEHDPAEITRTIEELKDRLSRYCGVVEKPRFHNDWAYQDRYYYDINSRPQTRDNIYPPRREDQYPVQMNMPPFDQSSYPYQTQLAQGYDLGRRMDTHEFHTPMNNWVSHHSGSCLDCIPRPIPQTPLNSRNPRDMLSANLNHYSSPLSHKTPLEELMARERWGSEPESDIDILNGARRPVMRRKNEQYCRSIAGGAPFIACTNCFESLKLPKNLIKGKNQVKCGACSFFICVEIEKTRLVIGTPNESILQSSELDGDSTYRSRDFVDSGNKSHNLKTSARNSTVEVRESMSSLTMQQNTLNKSQNLKTSLQNSSTEVRESKLIIPEKKLSFSSSEGNEESPSHFVMQQNTSNSAETLLSSEKPAPPLDKQSDCSSEHDGDWESIQSNRPRIVHQKIQSSQNSTEDVSESSELEDSFDEYPNTQTLQDSTEIDKEEDQTKYINGDEIVSTDHGKNQNVWVNGHLIPDHLVRKAENYAGRILPGDYWYDYEAGFWGVIGHPCLGIIPPCIEEFNYPMPDNCAAGNSGVSINGRELNQNDLDLLSGRGLPTTRDRFYLLDISGRVQDEESGKELYYLGKLAPTIEKMKRGFGMKVPRFLM